MEYRNVQNYFFKSGSLKFVFYFDFTVHESFPRNILNDGKINTVGVFKDFISALIDLLLTYMILTHI